MVDIRIRKYALIEFITQLESDSDLDAMEKVVATLKSATQPPALKTKTRKPKKEVPQSDTLTEKEAKNYVLRYNPSLKVYIKIRKDIAERISKTIDLEPIKKTQKMTREMIDELADKLDIQEPIEELLEMLKR